MTGRMSVKMKPSARPLKCSFDQKSVDADIQCKKVETCQLVENQFKPDKMPNHLHASRVIVERLPISKIYTSTINCNMSAKPHGFVTRSAKNAVNVDKSNKIILNQTNAEYVENVNIKLECVDEDYDLQLKEGSIQDSLTLHIKQEPFDSGSKHFKELSVNEDCSSVAPSIAMVQKTSSEIVALVDTPPLTSEESPYPSQGQESSCDSLDVLAAVCEGISSKLVQPFSPSHPSVVMNQENFCGLFGLLTREACLKLKADGHKMHRAVGGKLRHNIKPRLTPEIATRRIKMTRNSFIPGVTEQLNSPLPVVELTDLQSAKDVESVIKSAKNEKREWLRPPNRRSLDSDDRKEVEYVAEDLDFKKDVMAGARRSQRKGAVERRRWHHLLKGRDDQDEEASIKRKSTVSTLQRRDDMETDGEDSRGTPDTTIVGESDHEGSQSSMTRSQEGDAELKKHPCLLPKSGMRMIKSKSEPQIVALRKRKRITDDKSSCDLKSSPLHKSPKKCQVELKDKAKDSNDHKSDVSASRSKAQLATNLECLVPHMCRICWINDHMYCKNMKRIARDLPPCGGCLHYVPCEHYRHLRDSYLTNATTSVVIRPFESLLNPLPQPIVSSSDDDEDSPPSMKEPCDQPVKYATCADDLLCHEIMMDSDQESRLAEGTEVLTAQLKARAAKNNPRAASHHQQKKGRQSPHMREEQPVQVCDYGAEVVLDTSGRNLTKELPKEIKPWSSYYHDQGKKSGFHVIAAKKDDNVVLTSQLLKSSLLIKKPLQSVTSASSAHKSPASFVQLKRPTNSSILQSTQVRVSNTVATAADRVLRDDSQNWNSSDCDEEIVQKVVKSANSNKPMDNKRIIKVSDGREVTVSGLNSEMLGTLIMHKAMSLLHKKPFKESPAEETEEECADSITVLLSNSPEPEEDEQGPSTNVVRDTNLQYATLRSSGPPALQKANTHSPGNCVKGNQNYQLSNTALQHMQNSNRPIVMSTKKNNTSSNTVSVVSHSKCDYNVRSTGKIPPELETVIKVEKEDVTSGTVASTHSKSEMKRNQLQYGNESEWCTVVKTEPLQDEDGNDLAIDFFAEVDADGTVTTHQYGEQHLYHNMDCSQSNTRQYCDHQLERSQFSLDESELIYEGEVEMCTETVITADN